LTNVSSNSPILRKKYPRSSVRKMGTVTFRQKIRLSIKESLPVVKFLCLLYPNYENCQTRYTGLEISGMIKSVAKKAAQGLRRRKERK
jgi:hypothetical protein